MGVTKSGVGERLSRLALGGAVLALVAAGCTGAPSTETVEPGSAGTTGSDAGQGPGDVDQGTGDAGQGTGDAGQGTADAGPETGDGSGSPTAGTGTVPEGLEEFYGQDIAWESCDGGECATLTVPIDYAEPAGATIELALLRVPAGEGSQGSLVVNPGGPGGSGVDYARSAGLVYSDTLREHYDIVGFDPRGVGQSAPVTCFEDARMDEWVGFDPTPDDEAEAEAALQQGRDFAEACLENGGDLLGHVSTMEVVRDMDVLRSALGQEQLDYFGASYGTVLGSTYAEMFPANVGRFVLDGAVDPTMKGIDSAVAQTEGFERATRAYVEDCVADGDCPLGDDVDSAMGAIPEFLNQLDAEPIPLDGDPAGELTEGWAMYGIVVAMYDQAGWPILTEAIRSAQEGDGTMLMFLANLYFDRSTDGVYNSNSTQAFYAVQCLDGSTSTAPEVDDEEALERYLEVSPTWGRHFATMDKSTCESWPVSMDSPPVTEYDAEGAAPIVVIGTTRDPATPYEQAVALADLLSSGVLISYDGDGHTAYGRSNECVDDAVDAFLVEGTVPEDGLSC